MEKQITPELIEQHGLSSKEYQKILEILGREPTFTELGVFSAMWSEHCSYKSSKIHLKKFPTDGPQVIQGPGENAGVVDIGDGESVVFKVESHNHPSFIEPYQGAATGVGGILRDVFTMGARPIASMNSLRFGSLSHPKTRYLLDGVVAGIAGYGNCGRGLAMRAKGLGADVIVTEVDAVKALQARMDGYRVMPMNDAAKEGDLFLTVTGMKDVITGAHMKVMKDGAILGNSGHYNVEINEPDLITLSTGKRRVRHALDEYTMKDGRVIYLLGEGRLVNLTAAEGHPSEVMDLSFASQLNSMIWLAKHGKELKPAVYEFPSELDKETAFAKLKTMGISIDKWTKEQETYARAYAEGT